jgi:hypothetical protein
LFVGSTTELQRLLKDINEKEAIENDPDDDIEGEYKAD